MNVIVRVDERTSKATVKMDHGQSIEVSHFLTIHAIWIPVREGEAIPRHCLLDITKVNESPADGDSQASPAKANCHQHKEEGDNTE